MSTDAQATIAAQAARIQALEEALANVSVWLECDTDAIADKINHCRYFCGEDICASTAHARRIIIEALSGDDQ